MVCIANSYLPLVIQCHLTRSFQTNERILRSFPAAQDVRGSSEI